MGIAIPIVFAVIIVVGILIVVLSRHQANRVKATGEQVSAYSALEAAQAGLHLALAEMRATPGWSTHRLELQAATGASRWTDPLTRPLKTAGDPSGTGYLKVDKSSEGALTGTIGTGVFGAKFRVKVGRLPLADDPSTRAVDESNRYARIEVIGLKTERGKVRDRATRLDVLVERVNFTEYVLYDGEDIVIGLGAPNDRENANLIAEGWLFGRNFVHLGNIIPAGTQLKMLNMGRVLSDGPIRVWDPYEVTFQEPRGMRHTIHPANDSSAGDAMPTAGGNILDGNHRKNAGFPALDGAHYKRLAEAGGLVVSDRPATEDRLALFPEGPKIHLDFGHAGYAGSGLPPDDARALGKEYPKDFNGVIYSDRPLAVWGCPDRDVTIYCTQDVFVCGDFNARVQWRKDGDKLDWVGKRQNYLPRYQAPGQAPVDVRSFTYRPEDREIFVDENDPAQRVMDGSEDRKSCAVLSQGRVWFDARRPSRFLANELRPYIKYKIIEALAGPTEAYEWVRDDGRAKPVTDVALKLQNRLSTSLQELFDVRRKVTAADPRTRLYLTPESFEKVTRAFTEALVQKAPSVDDRGVITEALMEGTPGNPGLVDLVLEAMAADEDRAKEFPGAADDEPPDLAIWNAPQALYNMLYDERSTLGPQAFGPFSDWYGDPARQEFQKDELFMPQMTVNAMLISSAARNDPSRSNNPTDSNRRLDQLGNGTRGPHYLSSQAYQRGDKNHVAAPYILRVLGSQVRMANVKNHPPVLEADWYWPPMRRFIYDPALPFHPPPHLPSQLEIVSFKQRGATPDDFKAFE